MKFSNLIWLVVIALGITLFFMGGFNGTENPSPTPNEEDGQFFQGIPDQDLVQDNPDRSLITGPASCELSGTIDFSDRTQQ